MLTTNLLPSEEKKAVRFEDTRRILVFFGEAFAFIFLAGAVLLIPSFFPPLLQRTEVEKRLELEKTASSELEIGQNLTRVNQAQEIIKLIESLDGEPRRVFPVSAEIFSHAGPGVELTSFGVKRSGEVRISGVAQKRRDLLDFEKSLRDSGKFREITSPLANIVRETNVNFNISAQLK